METETLFDRPVWMTYAACADVDPELFFPRRGDNTTVANAKAVCADCPVRVTCLEYALVNAEKFGIWGGKSERERRRMRGARKAAA